MKPIDPSLDDTELAQKYVVVRGARTNNLADIDVVVPRDSLVVFTGVSGSGKSSLAFGTIYAEAQRRYLESVSTHARRLIEQVSSPDVTSIDGLPPAVALKQRQGGVQERSSVGSITRIAVALRLLYSRAGTVGKKPTDLPAEAFSPNNPSGACPQCHGLGKINDIDEQALVPDPSKSIREGAIAAWPGGWQGKNQRDVLTALGYNVDTPWQKLSREERTWILYSEEQPKVPVYPGATLDSIKTARSSGVEPSYTGTFTSIRRHILQRYAAQDKSKSSYERFLSSRICPACGGKRLNQKALAVKFLGYDITELTAMPVATLAELVRARDEGPANNSAVAIVVSRLTDDIAERIDRLSVLGLGHLPLARSATTLSSGELQRLRLATQLLSRLFGVVYILDEPSAGLHPADVEALVTPLSDLKKHGNSVFLVEHNLDLIGRADWIVDVGPGAGHQGGKILYSGPTKGLKAVKESKTAAYLFKETAAVPRLAQKPEHWLSLSKLSANNIRDLSVDFPLGRITVVTGISGSGKTTLVTKALPRLLGAAVKPVDDDDDDDSIELRVAGKVAKGRDKVKRVVQIDQKPIGRTPRSNLATYTGLFDTVRSIFASTPEAKKAGYGASRFSFNLPEGRCPNCEGQGYISVELMYMASVTARCEVCQGRRYNQDTLKIHWKGLNIAQVLDLPVDEAINLFSEQPGIVNSLQILDKLGLGYLSLGQPATELSGGESQRIKLSSELQRPSRGDTLYILDEPSSGLHPADMDRLFEHLDALAQAGNTVVMVEHDMRIAVQADWIIDMGPGAGSDGGEIVALGTPEDVSKNPASRTAKYLARHLATEQAEVLAK